MRLYSLAAGLILAFFTLAPAMAQTSWDVWDFVPWEVLLFYDSDNDGTLDSLDADPTGTCNDSSTGFAGGIRVINFSNPATPNPDLDALSTTQAADSKFCITQGTYMLSANVDVDAGDAFYGIRPNNGAQRPIVTTLGDIGNTSSTYGGVDRMFPVEAITGVVIDGLQIEKAQAWKTSAASGCNPNCGRGISGGQNMIVNDVRLTHNESAGIGGSHSGTWDVTNSEVDNNGYGDNGIYYAQDGEENAAGIKTASCDTCGNTFTNLNVHDNAWAGFWCDLNCGDFDIADSRIVRNGRVGIHFEVSDATSGDHAIFNHNIIQENGRGPRDDFAQVWGHQAGIIIVNSGYADITNNTFGGNAPELRWDTLGSQYDPYINLAMDIFHDTGRDTSHGLNNITVSGNTLNGDEIYCDSGRPGMSCTSSH